MKSRIILFIIGVIVWCILDWSLNIAHIAVGVLVSLLTTIVTGDLFVTRPHVFRHFKRYMWFLYYIPIFLWECFKANLDVAYRVAHPELPIKPGIVKVKTSLKTDTGLTFLANSITLTPGTMTVDIDKENGFLYIHWINVLEQDVEKATQRIVSKFENILREIFE